MISYRVYKCSLLISYIHIPDCQRNVGRSIISANLR